VNVVQPEAEVEESPSNAANELNIRLRYIYKTFGGKYIINKSKSKC
jgi:hypothetical protein